MFFSKRKKALPIWFLLVLVSIAHLTTKASNALHDQFSTSSLEQYAIDETQAHLESLHSILSGLSFIINDNQIPTENQAALLFNIQAMMRELESKKNILVVTNNPKTVAHIITVTQHAIKHINKALDSKCKKFKLFDITLLAEQTRKTSSSTTTTDSYLRIFSNGAKLDSLKAKANLFGLSWYNKLYRRVDKYILNYGTEYLLPISLTVLGIWSLWWIYDSKSCPGRTWLGLGDSGPSPFAHGIPLLTHDPVNSKKARRNSMSNTQIADGFDLKHRQENLLRINPNEYARNKGQLHTDGWFYKLNAAFANLEFRTLPVAAAIIWYAWDHLKLKWKLKAKPMLDKSIMALHYRLLGGSYTAKANKLTNTNKEVLFEDLIGLEHAKHECKYVINYMSDPETYIRRGHKVNHILFTGPPRTGKTELAKALYCEIKKLNANQFNFVSLPASWINMYGIDELLHFVKYQAPCIVFIDEIDMLNVQRSSKNDILSGLLQGMSGLDNDSDPLRQVIFIGATNKPEYLDFALMTDGRFGKIVHFEYPNKDERETFLKRQLAKMSLDLNNFDIDKIVRETEGRSFEALRTLIDHSVLNARLAGELISQQYVDKALDEELRKIVNEPIKKIPAHEKKILATHFAGHALAAHLLKPRTQLAKVTIRPVMNKLKEELIGKHLWQGAYGKEQQIMKDQERYRYGHFFTYHPDDTINLFNNEERIKLAKISLAGIAAEKLYLYDCGYSCNCNDNEQAIEYIKPIIFEGINANCLPKKIRNSRYEKIIAQVSIYEKEVYDLLAQHKDALENIIAELQVSETLDNEKIKEIVEDTEYIEPE